MSTQRIALIVGSVGRFDRLRIFLDSLDAQRDPRIRLILIEQRDLAGAERLLNGFRSLDVTLLSSEPGLSRARNAGLAHATEDIVAFPDDDCWYLPSTVSEAFEAFAETRNDFVIGQQVSGAGNPVLRTRERRERVTRSNIWRLGMSSAIFVRRSLIERVGSFDTSLGVGAGTPWGSGEETDLLLRAMQTGAEGEYLPGLLVGHPEPSEVPGRLSPRLGLSYGRGMGRVLRRHRYSVARASLHVLRPLAGTVVAAVSGDRERMEFRLAVARGRVEGYWASGFDQSRTAHVPTTDGGHVD